MTKLRSKETTLHLTGLLAGLTPGPLQSWGQLAVLPLLSTSGRPSGKRFVAPLENLKLVNVPHYGTMVLSNTAPKGVLIVPMHIGFFQVGAQNHATSRVIVLLDGETQEVQDCFCIQASQGGLLKEAQQRFIVLPLNLRKPALELRGTQDFSRLWPVIEQFNRQHGITRGGHLERFLRPNFKRLIVFRHTIETLPRQVGAAYFVAGRLVGIEVAPNAAYWQDVAPILNIYCYGAAALLAEQLKLQSERRVVPLEGIQTLEDLEQRLAETRAQERNAHIQTLTERAEATWELKLEQEVQDLRVVHLNQGEWSGQMVKEGVNEVAYLSAFRPLQ